MHAQFVNRKSESTVWCGNQTLDTLGATSQLHHSRLQSYITVFFILNVKQFYLCLMQKQLRNIFFAKKKDNIYKDFNVKVSINKLMKYILWRTVTAESWKCFLIWRLINTMLINTSHWSATSTQVKIMQLPRKRQRLISWKEQ